jgi:hypothetical protein
VIVPPSCEEEEDLDGDGFTVEEGDCDDNNPAINPGAIEICDGIDNNCDPETSDGSGEGWYFSVCDGLDADRCVEGIYECVDGLRICSDNTEDNIEICDGLDNDCNGQIDEGVRNIYYYDNDGDGFGDPLNIVLACTAPSDAVLNSSDCDDTNPDIHPGATEIPNNAIDEDCDGADLTAHDGNVADWFVDAGAPPGGDGKSWTTAFATIQSAVETASEGDEIWVKAGTYYLTETIILDKAVHLYGGFAGNESIRQQRDWENNATTINGENFFGNCLKITADATIDGFTITRCCTDYSEDKSFGAAIMIEGASPAISHSTFTQNRARHGGAAIYNKNASPAISECTFMDNAVWWGGGAILNDDHSSPRISHSVFMGNMADTGTAIRNSYDSSPVITYSTFIGNRGWVASMGEAIYNYKRSSYEISHSVFTGNYGGAIGDGWDGWGGIINNCTFTGNNSGAVGIWGSPDSPSTIVNSRFISNIGKAAVATGGNVIITDSIFSRNKGGAISSSGKVTIKNSTFNDHAIPIQSPREYIYPAIINERAESYIVNCLFTGNNEAILSTKRSETIIINSTFAGNGFIGDIEKDGGAVYSSDRSLTFITNSIFWGNAFRPVWSDNTIKINGKYIPADVTYSIVPFFNGQYDTPYGPRDITFGWEKDEYHNIDADPLFVNAAHGDFRVLSDSPAIDTGTVNIFDPPGLPDTDLDGNNRVIDGDEDGIALPDMGAYEYIPDNGILQPAPLSNTPPVAAAYATNYRIMLYEYENLGGQDKLYVGDTVQLDGGYSNDADGDTLSYNWSFVYVPTGSTTELSDPHAISPSFNLDVNGVYIIKLVVNDGKVDSKPDFLTLATSNRQPVANADADRTVRVGETVQLNGDQSYDPDGDFLIFKWELFSRPSGSRAALSNLRSLNPTFVPDRPGPYRISLTVYDGTRYSGFEKDIEYVDSVEICVLDDLNNVPIISLNLKTTEAVVGELYTYYLMAEDPEGCTLTYSLDVAPEGMTIDYYSSRNKYLITWIPTHEQTGEHRVVVRMTDPAGAYSTGEFIVKVVDLPDPPKISEFTWDAHRATEGEPYTYDVEATDKDVGDVLTFSLDEAPEGMTIDPVTGLIEWTPDYDQAGTQ